MNWRQVFIAIFFMSFAAGCVSPYVDAEKMDAVRRVEAAIRPGMTGHEVRAVFESNGVEHSYSPMSELTVFPSLWSDLTPSERSMDGRFQGVIRKVRVDPLIHVHYQFLVYMKDGTVREIKVAEAYTGL